MGNYVLTTDRLTLRRMTKDDRNNLMEIFSDPVAMKYYPSTKNKEQTMEWIERTLNRYATFGVGLWIVEKKNTGEFLGQCGIIPQEVDGLTEMEIGYSFVRRAWGNGYATEAAAGCKQYGFGELNFKRMISLIDENNIPSRNVAERIGMKVEKKVNKWGKELLVYSVYNDSQKA